MIRGFRWRHWPIRAKLAALLVAASLIPLALSAYMDIRQAREQRVRDVQRILLARGDQVARELDSIHRSYQRSALRVASLPAVQDYCKAPLTDTDRDGQRLVGVFATFPRSDPDIVGIVLTDRNGRAELATDASVIGWDLSSRPAVQSALRGAPAISAIALAPREGQSVPTIAYTQPVFDSAAQVNCVLVMGVRIAPFWEVLAAGRGQSGVGSYGVLADQWGVRVGHSRTPALAFHPAGPLPPRVLKTQVEQGRFGPKTQELLTDVRPFRELFDRATSASLPDDQMFTGVGAGDELTLGVARRLKLVPWTAFTMVPAATLDDELASATREKVLAAVLMIAAAGLVGVAFAASILGPVRALTRATDALAAGDMQARVPIHGDEELGRLAAQFNTMADQIRSQREALQISNADLSEHAAQLEASNHDLEAFSYSASHDLRAPLKVIGGFSSALQMHIGSTLDEKGRHYLSRIRAGVLQMDQVVDGLLRLGQVAREPLHKDVISAEAVVSEVLDDMRVQGLLTDDRVTVAPGLPAMFADATLMRQLFANLLSNACKFTSSRTGAAVLIGFDQRDKETIWFVRDNGVGFDASAAVKLFEPFHRMHATRDFAGLGIGLSIVRRIVERHGGRIWAESAEDQGATFYFTLGNAA